MPLAVPSGLISTFGLGEGSCSFAMFTSFVQKKTIKKPPLREVVVLDKGLLYEQQPPVRKVVRIISKIVIFDLFISLYYYYIR